MNKLQKSAFWMFLIPIHQVEETRCTSFHHAQISAWWIFIIIITWYWIIIQFGRAEAPHARSINCWATESLHLILFFLSSIPKSILPLYWNQTFKFADDNRYVYYSFFHLPDNDTTSISTETVSICLEIYTTSMVRSQN